MKKLFLFIISFVVLFSFSSFLKAECKDEDLNEWERSVGIDELDDNTKNQLKKIARRSEELLKED